MTSPPGSPGTPSFGTISVGTSRFDLEAVHTAAQLYYLSDATQAEIADRLGVSRPTVSRLVAEARRLGMVRIEIVRPEGLGETPLSGQLAEALGLKSVNLVRRAHPDQIGRDLAAAAGATLATLQLAPGDILLISSGRVLYEISTSALPALPGVVVAPTLGGAAETEAWHQTNEIVRQFAERCHGRPRLLYVPTFTSEAVHAALATDPDFVDFCSHWDKARAALVGIGAPPLTRSSISRAVPMDQEELRRAMGDVSLNFFDAAGAPVELPGAGRMIRIGREQLLAIEDVIGVAAGSDKVLSIIGSARAGYIDRLVTDAPTAELIMERLSR